MQITLTAARTNAGYTQAEMAEKLGVSRASLHAWETGKQEMKPAYLYAICQLTGFGPDDILLPRSSTKRRN